MPIGVIHDLAVGVDPGGADAWAYQDLFASGMSVGAPPDAFNQRGQDWGQPPWHPQRLAASGYAPYRDMLRHVLRHAGGLRLDHAMQVFRLWWVPEGASPADGTYVTYPHKEMLGVLLYEAHQAGAVVVGEDLGTVERLHARGVRRPRRLRDVHGVVRARRRRRAPAARRSGASSAWPPSPRTTCRRSRASCTATTSPCASAWAC